MEYWIVYDLASGEVLWRGSGSAGSGAVQALPEGAGLIVVPQAVIAHQEVDLAALRVSLEIGVDADAERMRQRFLTPGSGQAMTYARKETEARAWTLDNSVATPFLSAEAPARGMTIATLAAEVIALSDAWVAIGSAIEGRRMGAKSALGQAATLGALINSAAIDWSVLDAAA